jgi:predicted nucleic acid-binding protein
MLDATEMSERHARLLARLGERGVDLACAAFDRAMAADDAEVAARYMGAFHRLSRSARQTLALEAKLLRDRQRADREDRDAAAQEHSHRVERRKAQVKAAVERLIWTETEDDEAEQLIDDLDALLKAESLRDAFTAEPLDAHIAKLCRELGLAEPPADPPPLGASDVPGAGSHGDPVGVSAAGAQPPVLSGDSSPRADASPTTPSKTQPDPAGPVRDSG